jgi:hypothetical protein
MQWIHSSLNSISGWLQAAEAPPLHADPGQTEAVRQAMLACLGEAGVDRYLRLGVRIRFCRDALELWHLRSELMEALSGMHGEQQARRELQSVSRQFQGLVPAGMWNSSNRSSGLHSARA